jgi:hypothetical protein
MQDDRSPQPKSGNITPQDLADMAPHRHTDLAGGASGAPGATPAGVIGDSAGTDTTGAVAAPAELGQPGAASKLGGTPGDLATSSRGRGG